MSAVNLSAPWRDKAACDAAVIKDPFLEAAWFEENGPFLEHAKKVCLSCPVRNACLQDALNDEDAEGVRGGYWFDQGRLPVAEAREIRDTMDLIIGPHQSVGRTRKSTGEEPDGQPQPSIYL